MGGLPLYQHNSDISVGVDVGQSSRDILPSSRKAESTFFLTFTDNVSQASEVQGLSSTINEIKIKPDDLSLSCTHLMKKLLDTLREASFSQIRRAAMAEQIKTIEQDMHRYLK